ncbi:MAG: GNAT family N-acetyltransferase, partial [Rhodoplanes sp.]
HQEQRRILRIDEYVTGRAVREGVYAIRESRWPQDRGVVEELFCEYVGALGVDVSFQNVEEEFASLPGNYARPSGSVFLAWSEREPAGVVARRTIGPGLAEMKRLYVRPAFRGLGIARDLASLVITDARKAGISRIVLDTLGAMHAARALYVGLGFRPIPPYYENPLPDVVYLGLDLNG